MPESPIPANLSGLAHLAQGDREKATQFFERALEIDPEFVTAELNLARVDLMGNEAEKAQARYERVLKKQPRHLAALLGLAALAERRGDDQALVDWLTKAQDGNPTAVQPGLILARYYLTRNEALKALSVASELSSRFPGNDSVIEMLARAQALAGQTTNAIRSFEQLVQLRPDNADLYYLLGGIKWKGEDLYGAGEAFRRAIQIKPDMMNAYVALASVSLQAGRAGEALETAKRIQREFPDAAAGHQLEGTIYLDQKLPDQAVAPFQAALERERNSQIVRQLAQAQADSGKRDEAVGLLEAWVAEQPEDKASIGMLAMQYQLAGREADAITAYERLAEGDTPNVIVLNNLAWLYQKANDPRALETARKAYDLDPNRPEVADTYGWTLVQNDRVQEGLSILQQAYVSYPTQTEIGYHVAVALSRSGRNEEAAKILRRLLRESPTFEQAPEARALLAARGAAG
jgi:putative PEP-CTERM system TPR-repeat lipoprotein